jgi:MFS family permease
MLAKLALWTSAVLWGSAIAALLVGRLSDLYGRKKLLVACCIHIHYWCCGLFLRHRLYGSTAVARVTRWWYWIGIASIVPAYLSELAPAAKRGTIATLFQFMIVAGLLSAYVIDYFLITDEQTLFYAKKHGVTIFQGSLTNWQEMLGSAAIPAIILLIGALIIPESPRFLMKIGKDEKARAVLMNLRSNDAKAVDAELEEIELVVHIPSEGFGKLLKVAKPALIAACSLAAVRWY